MLYNTEKGLREALEQEIGYPITDMQWEAIKPDKNPPFVTNDLTVLSNRFEAMENVVEGALNDAEDRTYGRSKDHSSRRHFKVPYLFIRAWYKKYFQSYDRLRQSIGLREPISLDQLEATLVKMGATSQPMGQCIPLPYPRAEVSLPSDRESFIEGIEKAFKVELGVEVNDLISRYRNRLKKAKTSITRFRELQEDFQREYSLLIKKVGNWQTEKFRESESRGWFFVKFWDIGYVYIPRTPRRYIDNPLIFLLYASSVLSTRLKCHPALALGAIMSDEPLHGDHLIIVRDSNYLSIQVDHPEISAEIVRKAYTQIRNLMIAEKRKIWGRWARPRDSSQRVLTLIPFIQENKETGWDNLFKEWNVKHPEWAYRSIGSMQAVYYRLIRPPQEAWP